MQPSLVTGEWCTVKTLGSSSKACGSGLAWEGEYSVGGGMLGSSREDRKSSYD